MAIKYVADETAKLYAAADGNKVLLELLWGDHVNVLGSDGDRARVKARGKTGYVNKDALGAQSLLEIYFIDVGQGDGVLIRTPDDRHIMIDGGFRRAAQPSGKNAADFVDWKFVKDYGRTEIHLDVMMASHNDADHYGGLWDLLNAEQTAELGAESVRVDNFYHAGVAWWVKPPSGRWLGPTDTVDGNKCLTQLMNKRADVTAALKPNANPKLQGQWAEFMQCVVDTKTKGGAPTPITRLGKHDEYVPGFEAGGDVAIRVLAPVQVKVAGKPALRSLGTDSINTNGNSLLLRLDYGRVRILLTGDLNTAAQRVLLDDYEGERIEFQCDVAKACHHGSDDVSYEFLSAMRPAVTVISSGDNEGHDHPRPGIVAASATTGYLEIANDRIVSPLVYSTELARSVNLGKPVKLQLADQTVIQGNDLAAIKLDAKVTKAGDLNPTTITRDFGKTYVVAGLIYGLVNVRTDGDKIICATLNEKDNTWQVKTLKSRF